MIQWGGGRIWFIRVFVPCGWVQVTLSRHTVMRLLTGFCLFEGLRIDHSRVFELQRAVIHRAMI